MIVSIFNDVIGPVMRGPSSSHCAAALRIGRIARDLLGKTPHHVLIEFDRSGSLPTTHDSQGSDMGLFGGLMGWEASDERLPKSMEAFQDGGSTLSIVTVDVGDPHPNTYRLTVSDGSESHFLRAISTGGGMIEVLEIDGFPLSIFGDCYESLIFLRESPLGFIEKLRCASGVDQAIVHQTEEGILIQIKSCEPISAETLSGLLGAWEPDSVKQLSPVLPVLTHPNCSVPFNSCTSLLEFDAGRGISLADHAIAYESVRGGISEVEVLEKMVDIVRILRRSIKQGIEGTNYEDRVLGHQSGQFAEMLGQRRLLDAGALNRIVLYTTALMEVKSSMGVIVAMPTAGACAALPGAVIGMAEEMGLGEVEMARAILAAGLIGVFIATAWTFAAEVGGCQAEGGAASAMAAGALVTLAGGSLHQAVGASSMALQSMIGLICDPIANRVEAPCLGKNVMAASNAVCCANMALAGFDQVIPLDEVIETAKRVAEQMPRELRCTALGGLSITPTSLAIEKRLALRQSVSSRGCGKGSCGCG